MRDDRPDDYLFGYSRREIERLEYQHAVWEEENRRFLERAGFGEGETVVDLGCGPGFTTLDIASTVGPTGKVIAVDRDGERSLPLLRQRSEDAGVGNVDAREADLEDFDLPGRSVDGVYGRWVLMYLPETAAIALVRRAVDWLRPGGSIALAEFYNYRHIHIDPPSAHLPALAEALIRAVTGDRGCNPEIGRLLPGVLDRAGLEVSIRVVVKAVRAMTPEWSWPNAIFRDQFPLHVADGNLDRRVLDAFLAEWDERSRNPEAMFFGAPVLEVVARKPA
jgi:ubiquinone/menaquinone biosynthesis C-methylase UbiE